MESLALGLVHQGSVSTALAHLYKALPAEVPLIDEIGGNIPRQRNRVVQRFLEETDKTRLLFIDSDESVPISVVHKLLAEDEPIVCANVLERYFPFRVAGFWSLDYPPQRITLRELPETGKEKIAAAGTGCLLIHRSVFKGMQKPWFRYGEFEPDLASEDLGFCARAVKELGVQVSILCDARVGHECKVTVWPGVNGSPMMTFPGRPNSWTIPIPTL